MKKVAVIVGGGKGIRMGSAIPKQFMLIQNLPVIFHTIQKFDQVADEVVVVIPESHFGLFENLRKQYNQQTNIKLVAGGETRIASVMNGLNAVEGDAIVAIHDAVRPLLSRELIAACYQTASEKGSAVPVVPVKESLRNAGSKKPGSVNREEFVIAQTPQVFHLKELKSAYLALNNQDLTDDASVFEQSGGVVHHIEGETFNIKITYSEDLLLAEALLSVIQKQ